MTALDVGMVINPQSLHIFSGISLYFAPYWVFEDFLFVCFMLIHSKSVLLC